MLAVVQNQEQCAFAQEIGEEVGRTGTGTVVQAKDEGNGARDVYGVGEGGKVGEPDAVGEFRGGILGGANGETRFAAAADACQGDEARSFEKGLDFDELARASDETGERDGKVGGRRGRGGGDAFDR